MNFCTTRPSWAPSRLGLGTAGITTPANLGQPVLRFDPRLFDG